VTAAPQTKAEEKKPVETKPEDTKPEDTKPDVTPPAEQAPTSLSPANLSPANQTAPEPAPREEVPPPAVVPEKPKPSPSPAPVRREPRAVARAETPRLLGIFVTTNPPGSKAVIDGNLTQACSTPCTLYGSPGRHIVSISHAGFKSEFKEVNIGANAPDLPLITLEQPFGTLFLNTTPAGALIRVNGQIYPKLTPAALKLAPGTYNITVERNGVSKTERIPLGESVVRLTIPLEQ
jgi:hypothetical protein